MAKINQNTIHNVLGVINITPNSFSDGGIYKDHQDVSRQIDSFRNSGHKHFDFGAESTAPFNDKVDVSEELKRFEEFLYPLLEERFFNDDEVLSIDTYKVEVIEKVSEYIRQYYPHIEIWWNDVSGIIDSSVTNFLKTQGNCKYIFSHNLVTKRDLTNFHMDYIKVDLKRRDVIDFFSIGLSKLDLELRDKVILDPCFGFSKTLEQNYELIRGVCELAKSFSNSWLIGISKKSFLQALVNSDDKLYCKVESEKFHMGLLAQWMNTIKCSEVTFRIHDPQVFDNALKLKSLF